MTLNWPVELFALLGHRWDIANYLAIEPHNVTEIYKHLGLSQSYVSHNLQSMRRAGIVMKQADNKYKLTNSNAFIHLKESLMEMTK